MGNVKVMTILLGVLLVAASIPFSVEAARDLKEVDSEVHPQTFDLIGDALPMPGSGIGTGPGTLPPIPGIGSGVVFGTIPGPGNVMGSVPLPLPLPLPAIGTGPGFGAVPMPNIGSGVGIGSFPMPGAGSGAGIGSFPMPGGGSGAGIGVGNGVGFGSVPPMDFCAVPALGCVRVQPINAPPLGHGLGGGSNTPLPFP